MSRDDGGGSSWAHVAVPTPLSMSGAGEVVGRRERIGLAALVAAGRRGRVPGSDQLSAREPGRIAAGIHAARRRAGGEDDVVEDVLLPVVRHRVGERAAAAALRLAAE